MNADYLIGRLEDALEEAMKLTALIPEQVITLVTDNVLEFTAREGRRWLCRLDVGTLFIEPGSPWENGYIESLKGKLRNELPNREIFTTLYEAKVLIADWRKE